MDTYSLTTASSVYALTTTTAVQPLTLSDGSNAPSSCSEIPDQIVSVDVVAAANVGTATIALLLVDPNATDTKVRTVEATVTPTANRSNAAGTGGGYVCTVVFPDQTNKVDLNGHSQKVNTRDSTGAVTATPGSKTRWYIGCSSNAGLGTLTVNITPARAI